MKRSNRAQILAAAAISSLSLFSHPASGASFTWTGASNSNISFSGAPSNWSPTTALPAAGDDVFFAATSNAGINLNVNPGFLDMTFTSAAPAYTFSGGTITLGSSTPSGGNITNNSANIQTFGNTTMAFRAGLISAASGDIVFNSNINIGNNPNNNAGRNIAVGGSHTVTFNAPITGTVVNTSTAPPSDTTNWGELFMQGTSTGLLLLNANSTASYTGRIQVSTGIVRASNAGAFGANGTFIYNTTTNATVVAGTTHVTGGTNTGRVELNGGITFAPETLDLEGRSVTDTGFANFSGDNTWTGSINLDTGTSPGFYTISSDSGLMTISGNITNVTASNGVRNLVLRGASNGLITGNIVEGASASNTSPFKDGTGTWTFTGANTYTGITTVNNGTLQIGAGTTSGTLGTGSVTMSGGNLVFNRSDAITVSNPIGGNSGAVVINTPLGTTFTTNNTYSAATIVNTGSLQVGAGRTSGSLGTSSVSLSGGNLVFDRSDTIAIGNAIGGANGVVQAGNGQVSLTGNLSYQGPTTVQTGTLGLNTAKSGGGAININDNASAAGYSRGTRCDPPNLGPDCRQRIRRIDDQLRGRPGGRLRRSVHQCISAHAEWH